MSHITAPASTNTTRGNPRSAGSVRLGRHGSGAPGPVAGGDHVGAAVGAARRCQPGADPCPGTDQPGGGRLGDQGAEGGGQGRLGWISPLRRGSPGSSDSIPDQFSGPTRAIPVTVTVAVEFGRRSWRAYFAAVVGD
jgi:hypothetical protein